MEFSGHSCIITTTVLLVFAALLTGRAAGQNRQAICEVAKGSGNGTVSGTITLSQPNSGGPVTLAIKLNSLSPGKHGFHVHATKSLDNLCVGAGGHLNVDNTTHGAPTDTKDKRHTGDLGNIDVPASGSIDVTIIDSLISLTGVYSVIGYPIVIHSGEDDLGKGGAPTSNTTGNAGGRIGCCLIKDTTNSSTHNKSSQFVDAVSLEENVLYTVQTMQWLRGSTGYFYIIKMTKPGGTEYHMNIREGTMENNIYEKLEEIRHGTQKKRFTFAKIQVQVSSAVSAPYIVISGVNDVVNLN